MLEASPTGWSHYYFQAIRPCSLERRRLFIIHLTNREGPTADHFQCSRFPRLKNENRFGRRTYPATLGFVWRPQRLTEPNPHIATGRDGNAVDLLRGTVHCICHCHTGGIQSLEPSTSILQTRLVSQSRSVAGARSSAVSQCSAAQCSAVQGTLIIQPGPVVSCPQRHQ